jgi:hypothetical protein
MVIGRVLYVKDDPATSVITGPQLFTDCGPCWEDDVLEWR